MGGTWMLKAFIAVMVYFIWTDVAVLRGFEASAASIMCFCGCVDLIVFYLRGKI
jgi:hypothetical protein